MAANSFCRSAAVSAASEIRRVAFCSVSAQRRSVTSTAVSRTASTRPFRTMGRARTSYSAGAGPGAANSRLAGVFVANTRSSSFAAAVRWVGGTRSRMLAPNTCWCVNGGRTRLT